MPDRYHDKIAIIDIGSNSVRLVVYDGVRPSPVELFNEKVLCGLGEGMVTTGCLNPEGAVRAKAALRRFAMLVEIMQVTQVETVGTAALREAIDGEQFIQEVEAQTGFTIRLISGEEEAALSTLGAAASLPAGEGLVADLGGGSLELALLKADGSLSDAVSLPLGVLRLMDESGGERALAKQLLKDRLHRLRPWLKKTRGQRLILVGGSFRSLARLHMQETAYPLKLLHAYESDAEAMKRYAATLSKLTETQLPDVPEVTGKRRTTLPVAALILRQLIKQFESERVVFSSAGLREGVLRQLLSDDQRSEDLLLSAIDRMLERDEGSRDFGHALVEWLRPVLKNDATHSQRFFEAACRLMTLSLPEVAVFRAEEAFMRVMHAQLAGISHRERAMLAVSAFHRFRFPTDYPLPMLERLGLSAEDLAYGFFLGTLGGLAYAIAGGSQRVLATTRPDLHKGRLIITADDPQLLVTDAVQKRLHRANLALQRLAAEQKRTLTKKPHLVAL